MRKPIPKLITTLALGIVTIIPASIWAQLTRPTPSPAANSILPEVLARIARAAMIPPSQSATLGTQPRSRDSEIKPAPVLTGYASFVAAFEPGTQTLSPTLNPILLVPIGKRALVEAEFAMESELEHQDGMWGPKTLEKSVEYAQLDYFLHPNVTVVVGRFLTPFGIFNERLHPSWIKNLQITPLILGISHGSSTGGMLRGGIELNRHVSLGYAGYFSALTTEKMLESERGAGGRWSLFFPGPRLELGASFTRVLGLRRFNAGGFDATWNVRPVPLDLRAEYARSALGSGYWLEGAYRLHRVPRWNAFFRRSQAVARIEEFFAPRHPETEGGGMEAEEEGEHGGHESMLPEFNTQRVLLGWNYYLRENFKLSVAWGRTFSNASGRNIWSIGLSYRLLN